MLELLKITATSLGLSFSFGGLSDLNDFADGLPADSSKILFWNAYERIGLNPTASGYLTRSRPLDVFILSPSEITDDAGQRLMQIEACTELAVKVYKRLVKIYTLQGATLDPVITKTNNPLDGVQFRATLITNPESLC